MANFFMPDFYVPMQKKDLPYVYFHRHAHCPGTNAIDILAQRQK